MKRKFFLNLILLILLNVLIKPFYIFFIDRNVQNIVGTQEYGLYLSIFNFTLIINILLDLGIVNFNNKSIAKNANLLESYFASILSLRFLLGVGYIAIAFLAAYFMGYSSRQYYLLAILAFNQFLLSLILYLRSNISGLLMFVTDGIISVLDKLLLILVCSIFIFSKFFAGAFKIEWFIYAQTLSYLITVMVAFIIVVKKSKFKKLQWDTAFFVSVLKKSIPYATLTLLMSFYSRVDSVMLAQLIHGADGQVQVGIYAHAFRLLDALINFSYLFAVLLLPMFSKMLTEKEDVSEIVKIAFGILSVFVICFTIIMWFYSYEIMQVLYTDEIALSAKVGQIIMLSLPGLSYGYIFGTLLTANGNLKELNIISIVCVFINFVLNFILIPKIQVMGAAITSAITQSIVVILQLFVVKQKFQYKIDKKMICSIIKLLIIVAVSILSAYILKNIILLWYLKASIVISVVTMSSIMCKYINIKELYTIVKKSI